MSLKEQSRENELKIKELLGVPPDEPIFVLRAQDQFAPQAIDDYRFNVEGDAGSEWFHDVGSIRNDFINWQRDNRDKVKVPD
jgi:hypothetical protein